ncbi:cytochrome P450 CYP749A22-like [Rhododendron vialii]|uniref:cytochrome P450 CYP749A22-like n=1 Tax=Rhododendron vialii TaxID=182163 RepID=UPI00265DA2ED|nr:cytochrome P450 CYP749A22-like [Rhododendron vialii]
MGVLETITILLSCSLCFYLLFFLLTLLRKMWWTPIRIQRAMNLQGIRGPPYRFVHGNTKEILNMRTATMSKPMGLSHNIFPRLQPHLHSWLNIYGKNMLMWHGPEAQLVITDSEYAKEILNDKEKIYPKGGIEGFIKKLLGDGVVTSKGEKWAKQRKLVNHFFYAESLKDMVPAMIETVEMMLERWKHHEGKEIEVLEEFRLLTSEVISRTAFGSSYLEGKGIFEMLMKMVTIYSRNFFKIRLPGLSLFWNRSDDIESDKLEREIRDSITRMIRKRENVLREQGNFGTDLLGLLVEAYNDPDETNRITLEDVIDECKTTYIAGHETTTNLLSWTILLLAIYTAWQDELRKEVLELFGEQKPNAEGIARMKKMTMVINETLRLYPPVISLVRKVERESKLIRFVLPADIIVHIPTLSLHLDPHIWGEDAHLFNPERFSGGVAKATNNNPAGYIPFGLGPRNCAGMNFATNEAKIALSMILQRYAFTLSPTYVHSPIFHFTVRPEHGVQVVLHPL